MIKKIFLIIYILNITSVFSDLGIDPRMDPVINNFLTQQYTKAYENVENVLKSDPDNIDALFMRLNTLQIRIIDYESYVLDGYKFNNSIDSVLIFFEKFIQPADTNEQVKYLFYKGTIYGMKGLVLAKLGEWVEGVKYARASVRLLKQAQDLDSTLYEVSYGIGLYDYYLGKNLKWIPFMNTKIRKGIRGIKRVVYSPSPLSYMAKNSLAWIYIDKREYIKADAIVSSVLAKYPENTIFLSIKARVTLLLKKYEEAIELGRKLVKLSKARNPVNWSDLISAYQIIVTSLDATEKYEECLQAINEVMSLKVPDSAKKIEYVQKHLDFITSKKNKLEEKSSLEK